MAPPATRTEGKGTWGGGGRAGVPHIPAQQCSKGTPPSSVLCNEVQQGMRGTGGSLVLQEEGS